MLKKWMPWTFILQKVAKRYGFLDPATLLARLRRFGHPSEIQEPIELLRAGVLFHARGLVNTRAIQYNLDWIWPFWVVKQFTPLDASFIPRGFSFSHVNLTHRNWTAIGIPGRDHYPVIDPRGLVTPHLDGWSIDVWLATRNGRRLFPSREPRAEQTLSLTPELMVKTVFKHRDFNLETQAWAHLKKNGRLMMNLEAAGRIHEDAGMLIISIRPYNPEGIQFVDHIQYDAPDKRLQINQEHDLHFDSSPDKVLFSSYACGDVAHDLDANPRETQVECPIGMATAAACFPMDYGKETRVNVRVPLDRNTVSGTSAGRRQTEDIETLETKTAVLKIPDKKFSFLYDAAVQTLLLLTSIEVYPGPYTYKRFWFRDACLILHALLGIGLHERCRRQIETFPDRQKHNGYFQSQEGEWDSNGQVLWLAGRYHLLTRNHFEPELWTALKKGAQWIIDKRRRKNDKKRHDGLLPAGFSAEHLGPNDYYYWDNFWGIAGLEAAAGLAGSARETELQNRFSNQAAQFRERTFSSILGSPGQMRYNAIPASCYRRMDAGAVGSLVADYPLQITPPKDPLITNTIDYLMDHCFYNNAFFQDMIHSGLNAYLTLDIAQTLLRNNDHRYRRLIRSIANMASPTGQWPEAINPLTGGGCMGDGQHAWAAAEWIMMIKHLFIREEGDTLILGSGIFPEWLEKDGCLAFGPTLIPGGNLTVRFIKSGTSLTLFLEGNHAGISIPCRVMVPGYRTENIDTSVEEFRMTQYEKN